MNEQYTIRKASGGQDLEKIFMLRYEVLRQPWDQPYDTSFDELEGTSINVLLEEDGVVRACGRLQVNEPGCGQIRYMAVHPSVQGRGYGKKVLQFLEETAAELKISNIQLQARENAVQFYQSCGYVISEKTFLLWGRIQHYLMIKKV
jgi:N-acetylglutamate synthase-like GNAT family acetyltransferase